MKKKIYLGGLKVLLLPLFIMLLGMFSTCYARTTLTDDEAEYLYNYLFNYTYSNTNNLPNYINFLGSNNGQCLANKNSVYQEGVESFKNQFNTLNTLEIDPNKTVFWVSCWGKSDTNLIYGNFNNGKNNDLPHLYFRFRNNNSGYLYLRAIDDNKQELSTYNVSYVKIVFASDSLTIKSHSSNYNINNASLSDSSSSNWYYWKDKSSSWNLEYLQNGKSIIENIPGVVSFSNTNAIYTNYNGQVFFDSPQTRLLKTLYVNGGTVPDDPDEPVPDTGNTGTITDNNGDTTGQIDLSGIQNGLGNINNSINQQGQAIIDNQNQNTQSIIDNQNSIAQQQHNDLTNYDVEDGEEDVSGLIDNIQGSLSGDLSNSEIFGALEESEQGFLNLISGQAEDFEIHWNDVIYNNVKLIPAGQVNFSKMCRENPALGNIKEKLNIILSALCGLALIRYLYNLLLATLGIDNPYLYDNNSDSDYIKTVDKNTGVTTFSGREKDGTRWSYRYNPNSKGGKNK